MSSHSHSLSSFFLKLSPSWVWWGRWWLQVSCGSNGRGSNDGGSNCKWRFVSMVLMGLDRSGDSGLLGCLMGLDGAVVGCVVGWGWWWVYSGWVWLRPWAEVGWGRGLRLRLVGARNPRLLVTSISGLLICQRCRRRKSRPRWWSDILGHQWVSLSFGSVFIELQ